MLKKLCGLLWEIIKSPFSSYPYCNLWFYLKHGYTITDYTNMDLYLLRLMSEMSTHLAHHYSTVCGLDILSNDLPKEYTELLKLADAAKCLYVDLLFDIYDTEELSKHRKDFLEKVNNTFFNLWV